MVNEQFSGKKIFINESNFISSVFYFLR